VEKILNKKHRVCSDCSPDRLRNRCSLWFAARFAIPRSEVGMSCSGMSYPAHDSCASYAALSLPSPCGRRCCLVVLWSDVTPRDPSDGLLSSRPTLPSARGATEPPRFQGASLRACHALRPRQALQDLTVTIPSFWLPVSQHHRRPLL
jgi:hypothetical protein